MEGRIGAESRPGEGSCFWFEVALPRERFSLPAGPVVLPPVFDSGPVDFGGALVLVVEDTPVNQKITTRLLERVGCHVRLARDGREAVETFLQGAFDLVLMDCQMPGMDGFEATKAIRLHEAGRGRAPIVALTANAQSSDRERCLAAGMDDFLAKPLQAASLERVLRRWLARRAA